MFSTRKNLKIVNMIVGLVLVFVVNNFATEQSAPQVLFHNFAVFAFACAWLVGDASKHIAALFLPASTLPSRGAFLRSSFAATSVGTIDLFSFDGRAWPIKFLSAESAHATNRSWFSIATGTRTVLNAASNLGWQLVKGVTAGMTNVGLFGSMTGHKKPILSCVKPRSANSLGTFYWLNYTIFERVAHLADMTGNAVQRVFPGGSGLNAVRLPN